MIGIVAYMLILQVVGFFILWFGIRILSKPIGGHSIGLGRAFAMSIIIWFVSLVVMFVLGMIGSGLIAAGQV